jgi:hypothetical protein
MSTVFSDLTTRSAVPLRLLCTIEQDGLQKAASCPLLLHVSSRLVNRTASLVAIVLADL